MLPSHPINSENDFLSNAFNHSTSCSNNSPNHMLFTCESSGHVYTSTELFSLVAFILEGVLGAPPNLLIVFVILTNKQFQSGHNFFVLSLSLIESIHCINVFLQAYNVYDRNGPTNVHNMYVNGTSHANFSKSVNDININFSENGSAGITSCNVAAFITFLGIAVNDFNYGLIAINRYVGLCCSRYTFERTYTGRNILLMILFIWALSFVLMIQATAMNLYGFEELLVCGIRFTGTASWVKPTVLGIDLLVPWLNYNIVLFCNHNVIQKLKLHGRNKARLGLPKSQIRETRNIVVLLVINSLLPGALNFPGFLLKALSFDCQGSNEWVCRVVTVIFGLRPTLSPYILICCLRSYRNGIRQLLGMAPLADESTDKNSKSVAGSRQPSVRLQPSDVLVEDLDIGNIPPRRFSRITLNTLASSPRQPLA